MAPGDGGQRPPAHATRARRVRHALEHAGLPLGQPFPLSILRTALAATPGGSSRTVILSCIHAGEELDLWTTRPPEHGPRRATRRRVQLEPVLLAPRLSFRDLAAELEPLVQRHQR